MSKSVFPFPIPKLTPPGPDLSSIKDIVAVISDDIKRDAAEVRQTITSPDDLSFTPAVGLPHKMEAKDVSVARLRAIIERAKKGPITPEGKIEPPSPVGEKPVTRPNNSARAKGVSDVDTMKYQNIELVKELLLLDKHFQQGCALFQKPCDCCEKHPLTIQALAEESYGISGNPLYMSIAAWAGGMGPFVDAKAPRDKAALRRYAGWSLDAREYRKSLMGSGYISEVSTDKRKAYVDAFMEQMQNRLGPEVLARLNREQS